MPHSRRPPQIEKGVERFPVVAARSGCDQPAAVRIDYADTVKPRIASTTQSQFQKRAQRRQLDFFLFFAPRTPADVIAERVVPVQVKVDCAPLRRARVLPR